MRRREEIENLITYPVYIKCKIKILLTNFLVKTTSYVHDNSKK